MLTREETKKIVARIFDSIRPPYSESIGDCDCDDFDCIESKCPFRNTGSCVCPNTEGVDSIFNVLEFIENWAKDHPPTTYEQKYEKTFGVEPKDKCGDYACPRCVGFLNCECRPDHDCERCKSEFWNSEYKEPKRGE